MRIRRIFSTAVPLLLLSLLSSRSGSGSFAYADLVGEVCSNTQDPSFCLKLYKSDHSATSLVQLCSIAIKRGKSSAAKTKKLIYSLLKEKGTMDPSWRSIYETCSETYGMAIDNLEDARDYLKPTDPVSLNVEFSATMTDVYTCEDGFGKKPIKPRKLMKGNKFLVKVCDIGLAISLLMNG